MAQRALDQALGWVETVVNRLLEFDPDTRARLVALAGKVICLELRDAGAVSRRVYLMPAADALHFSAAHDRADVTIGARRITTRLPFVRASLLSRIERSISSDA